MSSSTTASSTVTVVDACEVRGVRVKVNGGEVERMRVRMSKQRRAHA
jgi:hypothetical protein